MNEQTPVPEGEQYVEHHHRRRSRRRRPNRVKQARAWSRKFGLPLLLGLLIIAAIIPLFDPFSLYTLAAGLLEGGPLDLLVRNLNSQILGGALLLTTTFTITTLLRRRVLRHMPWWDRQCPLCSEAELRRIHRTWFDRLIGLLGFPVRRYICRNCGWQGLRFDEKRIQRW